MVAEDSQTAALAVSVEELATSGWLKEDAEVVLKYKDVVKQVLINAVKKVHSCVLRYEHILDEIYALVRDDDEAWLIDVSFYSILILTNIKIDSVVAYKIYADESDATNDVLVVLFGKELTKRQVDVLSEVASLFKTKLYDRYNNEEGKFYDASPISRRKRVEVYTVMHNLVNAWTNCLDAIKKIEEGKQQSQSETLRT
jgi:hypothetical protein